MAGDRDRTCKWEKSVSTVLAMHDNDQLREDWVRDTLEKSVGRVGVR